MIDHSILENTVHSLCEKHQLPGMSVCLTDSTGEDHLIAVGVRQSESYLQLEPDDHQRVGSITKIFISTLILKLQEIRQLSLDQTVESILPGTLTHGSRITVRHLLQHRSGLKDYIWVDVAGTKSIQHAVSSLQDIFPPRSLVRLIANHDLEFEPGTEYHYSNTGYIVLGMIVEKLSGKSIEDVIDQWIIQPLQLKRTYFPLTNELRHPFATGHSKATPDMTELSEEVTEINKLNISITWTAGALVSTPFEIQTFMKAVFNGTLLSEESRKEMLHFHETDDTMQSYGLGLQQFTFANGVQAVGHQGVIHGYESVTLYYPDHEVLLTVIVNQMPVGVVSIVGQLYREVFECDK
ncbi:serine hydrolase [uncultured Rossellomorea sp.]|uniref:serine hydrolase domain-containing protein n=1 Tax=uncultured Rossellomorea sp. TaxID=2837549 RepID=UPI0026073702|nr:serine hydrolase domain-containing protein [uncultured Rossellomorea sp.]